MSSSRARARATGCLQAPYRFALQVYVYPVKPTNHPYKSSYVSLNKGAIDVQIISILLMCLLLVSCEAISTSTLPSSFTTENIMKVHQGMSSDEILTLFGEPKNIGSAVCGRPPDQWTCTTWEYGEFPYSRASFTFSGEHNSLKLNDFKIDRD